MVVMLTDEQWNKVRELLVVELETERDLLNNGGDTREHLPVIEQVQSIITHGDNQKDGSLVHDVIRESVVYVHAMCLIDQGTIDMMVEQVDADEGMLFDGFEQVSQVMGFKLQDDVGE